MEGVDFLGQMFLAARLVEKGAPVTVSETVTTSTTFPVAGTAMSDGANATGENSAAAGTGIPYERIDGRLTTEECVLQPIGGGTTTGPRRRQEKNKGHRHRQGEHHRASNAASYTLVKRAAKECDSGTVGRPSPSVTT